MKIKKLVTVMIFCLVFTASTAGASSGYTWNNISTGTPASGTDMTGIAMSASGKYVAAAGNGTDIFTSSDFGVTWTNRTTGTPLSGQFWSAVASSSNGQYLVAANTPNMSSNGGDIYTSDNFGSTWTNRTTGSSLSHSVWRGLSVTPDGQKVAASTYYGNVYTSTNFGSSWANVFNATPGYLNHMPQLNDGQHLVIGMNAGDIFTSSDFGSNWTNRTAGTAQSGAYLSDSASSYSGQFLSYAVPLGDIYTSNNYGATWANRTTGTSMSGLSWEKIASSYTGQYLAATDYNGDVYTSGDSGTTWTNSTTGTSSSGHSWFSVAISYSGQYIDASGNSEIYGGVNAALAPLAPGISAKSATVTVNGSIEVDVLSGVSGFPDEATLSITLGPAHGTAVDPPGTITYTPTTGYVGSDSLTYRVCSTFDPAICSSAVLGLSVVPGAPATGHGAPKSFLPGWLAVLFAVTGLCLVYVNRKRKMLAH